MKSIVLSKREREALRLVAAGAGHCPSAYPADVFNASVRSLDRLGLVEALYEEGGGVADSRLSDDGRLYLATNPRLRNPVDWRWIATAAISLIAAIAAIAALFISCANAL